MGKSGRRPEQQDVFFEGRRHKKKEGRKNPKRDRPPDYGTENGLQKGGRMDAQEDGTNEADAGRIAEEGMVKEGIFLKERCLKNGWLQKKMWKDGWLKYGLKKDRLRKKRSFFSGMGN